MQKVRRHPRGDSDRLSVYDFRFYFTPLTGVLFNFPSRYYFTIGLYRVFSLTPWPGRIHAKFPVLDVT